MAMYDTRRPYQVSLREEFRMRTVRIQSSFCASNFLILSVLSPLQFFPKDL
jgi:hypothetical protein